MLTKTPCAAQELSRDRGEGSRKRAIEIQRKNVEDMKKAGAEVCIFNCPACLQTLGPLVSAEGIRPMHMSDLCRPRHW